MGRLIFFFMAHSPSSVSDFTRKSLAWLLISLQLFSLPIAAANEAIVENIETLYEAAIAEQASETVEVPTPEVPTPEASPEDAVLESETIPAEAAPSSEVAPTETETPEDETEAPIAPETAPTDTVVPTEVIPDETVIETPAETDPVLADIIEMPADIVSADNALFSLDSSKVIADTLASSPDIHVSDTNVEIKLADWDMPGKEDGDSISHSEALSVILGMTTTRKNLAQIMIHTLEAAPLPDDVNASVAEQVKNIYSENPLINEQETLSTLSEELIESETLSEYVEVILTADDEAETVIPTSDIKFISGSLIMSFPMRDAEPGLYTVSGTLRNPLTGEEEYFSQDFAWGVLAINSDQDIYQPGDTAQLSIGILNDG